MRRDPWECPEAPAWDGFDAFPRGRSPLGHQYGDLRPPGAEMLGQQRGVIGNAAQRWRVFARDEANVQEDRYRATVSSWGAFPMRTVPREVTRQVSPHVRLTPLPPWTDGLMTKTPFSGNCQPPNRFVASSLVATRPT